MEFRLTNCVALQTSDPQMARGFYENVMGMKFDVEEDGSPYTKCGALNLFLGSMENYSGPVLDFLVDDVEKAKDFLLKNGCEILKWDDCSKFIRDPFGLCFNLYPKQQES